MFLDEIYINIYIFLFFFISTHKCNSQWQGSDNLEQQPPLAYTLLKNKNAMMMHSWQQVKSTNFLHW